MAERPFDVGGLFDPSVVVLAAKNEQANIAQLTPSEARLVAGALPKRMREFATARALARAALARFGRPNVAILHGPDRCPIWPAGLCGSLSHCDTLAVAAVAERPPTSTIGIDAEHRRELMRESWSRVLLADEIYELEQAFPDSERKRMALVLFSAKEAFHKAQYPRSGRMLGFHAVRVFLDPGASPTLGGSFQCSFRATVEPFAPNLIAHGRYRFDAFANGELVTGVWIEAP